MANRALIVKAERAARQRRELATVEFSKPFYARSNETLASANARREELNALVAAFTGTIVRCPDDMTSDPQRKRAGYDGTRASRRARAELTGSAVRAGSALAYGYAR